MDGVISTSYLWHNYGNTTIGNTSDIERVPIENLKAFYKKYYRPDNAVLMVTGKFDTEKTLNLINKKFGVLKNPETPLVDVPTIEPEQDGEKHGADSDGAEIKQMRRMIANLRSVTNDILDEDSDSKGNVIPLFDKGKLH